MELVYPGLVVRSKADETFVRVKIWNRYFDKTNLLLSVTLDNCYGTL